MPTANDRGKAAVAAKHVQAVAAKSKTTETADATTSDRRRDTQPTAKFKQAPRAAATVTPSSDAKCADANPDRDGCVTASPRRATGDMFRPEHVVCSDLNNPGRSESLQPDHATPGPHHGRRAGIDCGRHPVRGRDVTARKLLAPVAQVWADRSRRGTDAVLDDADGIEARCGFDNDASAGSVVVRRPRRDLRRGCRASVRSFGRPATRPRAPGSAYPRLNLWRSSGQDAAPAAKRGRTILTARVKRATKSRQPTERVCPARRHTTAPRRSLPRKRFNADAVTASVAFALCAEVGDRDADEYMDRYMDRGSEVRDRGVSGETEQTVSLNNLSGRLDANLNENLNASVLIGRRSVWSAGCPNVRLDAHVPHPLVEVGTIRSWIKRLSSVTETTGSPSAMTAPSWRMTCRSKSSTRSSRPWRRCMW